MNDEILSVLKEIAAELKTRNNLTRESTARSEERMSELASKRSGILGEKPEEYLKSMREESEQRLARINEDAKKRQQEKSEFEKELVAELRRINANLEALRGSSSSPSHLPLDPAS